MQEILTAEQVRRTYSYVEALIRNRWGKWLDWIFDDLKQDFVEHVIRSVLKGVEFQQALRYGRNRLIDILRGRLYYFSCRNPKTGDRYSEHARLSQMDPETWDEFHGIHSHNPEPGYVESVLTQQLLAMMGEKQRKAWELRIEGWTQDEIADKVGKVGRSMISNRLTKGVAQVQENLNPSEVGNETIAKTTHP